MKLRITQNKQNFYYVEEDIGVKRLFRAYVPDWQICRRLFPPTVESLNNYASILHYEVERNNNAFITKEEAIAYAKCIWYVLSDEGKARFEAETKKANERVVIAVLEFYFDGRRATGKEKR